MALQTMTPQQAADVVLRYWQSLRDLPVIDRQMRLEEFLQAIDAIDKEEAPREQK